MKANRVPESRFQEIAARACDNGPTFCELMIAEDDVRVQSLLEAMQRLLVSVYTVVTHIASSQVLLTATCHMTHDVWHSMQVVVSHELYDLTLLYMNTVYCILYTVYCILYVYCTRLRLRLRL